ncbi:bleomycin resistance protein [uncultured Brevundimonas sp.]|uniref:bleomycin resistance protein n=1 Tax=uncultured Brevundimonas sp. TaxID=213418 RepID=UPI0030ECE78E|tara:strand:- start:125102 stop:125467 length:366 start_codon:yes stop_codon:yes gene_type:complete
MTDHATPNLPARDFELTSRFYQTLGFEQGWRDAGWMILRRGAITLEFFPYPDLDPAASSFGCCLRLDDLDAFYGACLTAGVPEQSTEAPRLQAPKLEASGLRIGYLIDPDGSLIRIIQNPR